MFLQPPSALTELSISFCSRLAASAKVVMHDWGESGSTSIGSAQASAFSNALSLATCILALSIKRTRRQVHLENTSHWPIPGYMSLSQPSRGPGTNFGPALRPSSMHIASRLQHQRHGNSTHADGKRMPILVNHASQEVPLLSLVSLGTIV